MIKKAWYFVFCWMWYGVGYISGKLYAEKIPGSAFLLDSKFTQWAIYRSLHLQAMAFGGPEADAPSADCLVWFDRTIPTFATKYWQECFRHPPRLWIQRDCCALLWC